MPRQGKLATLAAFYRWNSEVISFQVHILQPQKRYFRRTQSEGKHAKRHGPIPAARPQFARKCREQSALPGNGECDRSCRGSRK